MVNKNLIDKPLNNNHRVKRHLVCSDEVFKSIVEDCMREYIKHHPEMEGAKISQNHILKQISNYYLQNY